MKNKKMVAQLAALSLVFGLAGAGVSWADEIIIQGDTDQSINKVAVKNDDGSFTVSDRDVKGVWLREGAKLTANNVNFIDGGKGNNEVGLERDSTLIMTGGSIDHGVNTSLTLDGGRAEITNAKVTSDGAYANNGYIQLKDCTTSVNVLYAGNGWGEGKVEDGLEEGTLVIDGGTANALCVLVQNKATFQVTNGAVLDLTGDTSVSTDEWRVADDIAQNGKITIRAWGPNVSEAEKENNSYIQSLDKATWFRVSEGATVKADTIALQGKTDDYANVYRGTIGVKGNSTVTTNTMNFGQYSYGSFEDSQLTVNGKLSIEGIGYDDHYKYPYGVEMVGGSAALNEVSVTNYGELGFSKTTVTAKAVSINDSLVKVSDGATVKADSIDLLGKKDEKDNVYRGKLRVAGNSSVTADTMSLGQYGYASFEDSQLTVNGKLSIDGIGSYDYKDIPYGLGMVGGSAALNEVSLTKYGELGFNNTAVTAKTVSVDDAIAEVSNGSFQADTVDLSNEGEIDFYDGVKANVGELTADNSFVSLSSASEAEPDVTISQMTLKNNSELSLVKGTLHSDVMQLQDSAIDIVGVGSIVAKNMTLTNATLSLNGITNNQEVAVAYALEDEEDIVPYATTLNGGSITVTDELNMDKGSELLINGGSSVTTNKLTLVGDSTISVSDENSSYTIEGADNMIDSGSKVSVTNGGTVKVADGAGIKATADEENKVNTVIEADESSTVEFGKDTKLFIKEAKTGDTQYDISNVVKTANEEAAGQTFDTVYGDNIFTKGTKVGDDGKVVFKTNYEEAMKTSGFANIIQAVDKSTGDFKDFLDYVYGEGTNGDITKGNAALDHAAAAAEMAGVTHGTYGFAEDFSGLVAAHRAEGQGVWAQYLHQDKKVDGFQVAGREAKYDVKYNGFLIGGDFAASENSRTGIAFAYANGSNTTKDGVYTKNDTKYYGGDIYHQFTAGGIQYKADVGYIKSDNDLKQIQMGTTITGSTDGNAFFAGIRGEKEISLGSSSLTPYVGLRFYRVHTGDFTDSLGMKHETENANIWNLPVGVVYRHAVQNGAWSVTPVAEVGYNFVMGDKDSKETVRFGDASDVFAFDIGESTFVGRLGVEANNGIWNFGGGYRYQKGSDTQSNQWYVQAGYRF